MSAVSQNPVVQGPPVQADNDNDASVTIAGTNTDSRRDDRFLKTKHAEKHEKHEKTKSLKVAQTAAGKVVVSSLQASVTATPTVPLAPATIEDLKLQLAVPVTTVPGQQTANHRAAAYAPNQLVVVGMDSTALTIASQLGFSVSYVSGDGDAYLPITRLIVPAGSDTLTAWHVLKAVLPNQIVALNSLYHIYSKASGSAPNTAPNTSAVVANGECKPGSCKPWSMIGWQSYLRGCSSGVRVGMIDTGVDTTHPALADSFARDHIVTAQFRLPGRKPATKDHGTAVASLLMGDERTGMGGLIPDATLYAADAFYSDGDQTVADSISVLKALQWLDNQGVRIVNLSFAGPDDKLLEASIGLALQKGMIIVAAAGNEGAEAPAAYPAAYDGVIAVTAVGTDFKPYVRANQGSYISFAAPGVHIWTAGPNGVGTYETGTSFAAPYVTAMAATVLNSAGVHNSWDDILNRIPVKDLSSASDPPLTQVSMMDKPARNSVFGYGLALAPAIGPEECRAVMASDWHVVTHISKVAKISNNAPKIEQTASLTSR